MSFISKPGNTLIQFNHAAFIIPELEVEESGMWSGIEPIAVLCPSLETVMAHLKWPANRFDCGNGG